MVAEGHNPSLSIVLFILVSFLYGYTTINSYLGTSTLSLKKLNVFDFTYE